MTEIWLVTTGRYDDYSVEAVFTSFALAVEFCSRMNAGHEAAPWLSEYELDMVEAQDALPEFVEVLTIAIDSTLPNGQRGCEWVETYSSLDVPNFEHWRDMQCDVERDAAHLYVCGSNHDMVRRTFALEYASWMADKRQ